MLTTTDTGLLDAAAELLSAGDPHDALTRLRARHPDHRLHLLADVEAYDGSIQHALLIRRPDGVTLSLSAAAGPGLPWALRGAARAREFDLLAVNGVRVAVADALATVDALFDDPELLRCLIDACLIGQAVEEREITVSDELLQETADAFRRAKGLHTAEATRQWLAERSLTPGRFAELIDDLARTRALRALIAGDAVGEWFASHGHELDVVTVAYADVDDPALLASDPLAAIVAAHRAGRAGGVRKGRAGNLQLEGHTIVLDRRPAVLDAKTRDTIERRLFDAWLAEQRRTAHVEWFWGDDARTRRAAA
ncbi:TIGR04500 family putative peptide maturation system protein [Solirubrobacter soli]|uniref:TIGR04500 family putative peptide maturation system protein n=1 Tax=Solirubrobacter soli TaxID=363832 RepID=UPI00040FAFFA|nr:TIGR04500 family putative peptide maturation system protein [Solirubrobacter soli]